MQKFQVRSPDHGEHRDGGARDRRKLRHLPKAGDAHFHHRGLVLRLDARDRHGYADLVVVVPLRLQNAIALGQDRGDHLLGRRLAHAAGNADHGDMKRFTVGGADLLQGALHVLYEDHGTGDVPGQIFREGADRPLFKGALDIAVPVRLLPAVGDEQVARPDRTAVDHRARNCAHGVCAADQFPAAGVARGPQRHRHHTHQLLSAQYSTGSREGQKKF